MAESRVASRYAKSLLELAREKGVLDRVHEDMQLFVRILEANRELHLILSNPIIYHDKKFAILDKVFGSRIHDITASIFKILVSKNREGILLDVARQFHAQYQLLAGVQMAELRTATALTEDQRKKFADLIVKQSGKKIEIKEKIDPSLIGGFILKIGDNQIDASVSSRLQSLRKDFSYNPYIKEF